ncbi:P-loop containing nucleoside triphosphate hydrolase protein [Achaetomium macrosporum]|uniref:RNA helicase n=1 Tax=Achaetomium macrosporum TaxID=79813 RepID=A0AAN7CEN6_9PEZI|nr:P-loop containing nucleoside triphosphate hydrolase protein [Achaetomium macrosporum]
MGRLGAWFKKSDDKENSPSPSSNPYAQQQPSPPPQYDQYNGNQYSAPPVQGPPSGLPTGPRPGGLPSRIATGPPQYSTTGSQPPPYSAGTTSASSTSSPSLGAGYPREKFGAPDGVGRNRFDVPPSSSYDHSASLPSQRRGGYGNLDTDGGLFANYTPPSKRTASAALPGPDGLSDAEQAYDVKPPMTEEEQDEANAQAINSQAKETREASRQKLFQLNQMAETGLMSIQDSQRRLLEQGEVLAHANGQIILQSGDVEKGRHNLDDLDRANRMINIMGSKEKEKMRAERAAQEKKALDDLQRAQKLEREAQRRANGEILPRGQRQQTLGASGTNSRSPYVFEEEDEEIEKEIDDGLASLAQTTKLIHQTAKNIGGELDYQEKLLATMDEGVEKNQDGIIKLKHRMHSIGPIPTLLAVMSRKRKTPSNDNVIEIGGKAISLEGYLTKKPRKQAAEPVPDQELVAQDAHTSGQPSTSLSSDAGKVDHRASPSLSRHLAGDPQYFAARQALPLWTRQDEIRRILRTKDVLVLVGETGSGKSTQVPQFLYQEKWCQRRRVKIKAGDSSQEVGVGGMIAITQPRRVAATTLAHRVSREAGTPLTGQKDGEDGSRPFSKGLVGYSVRFDHRVPPGTRIKFLTEGMLLQELLRDPCLRQYSAVIVDEIHERSVDVDLLSGFLKQIILGDKAGRGGIPLKVVIMSATANVESITRFFSDTKSGDSADDPGSQAESKTGVECLKIEGRQFPVDIIHTPKPVPDIQEALIKLVFKIHNEEALSDKHGRKDILAFLTGQEEIEAAQRLIEEYASTLAPNLPKIKVFPLFGQLSIEAQHEAFQPIKGGFTRKVVLATNIAETSVTVPGVRYVIDCGKAKVKQFRPRLGMESLLAKPISKSSAIQRAGRAGREGPGKCFRLYTEETYETLQKTDLPEILRTDILSAILTMKARGIDDVLSFPLMDPPELESVEKALVHLHVLGALADDGSITETGRKMVLFPVTPPYARVLLAAAEQQYDCLLETIDIISCITSGEDIFLQLRSEEEKEAVEEYRKELSRREGDILTYLTTMQLYAAENADRTRWCRDRKINIRNMKQAMNIRKQLRQLCVREGLMEPPPADPQPFTPTSPEKAEVILKCFLRGFALRTAILAPDSSYVTSHGKHVVAIHPSSVLHGQKKEAIMFLEHVYTQKNYAKKVSAIQAAWIAEALDG